MVYLHLRIHLRLGKKCLIRRLHTSIFAVCKITATKRYVACPKSPVTHTFYECKAGTNNSYSCRITGHIGTYFTVQNDTHFNDITATVTLVTISRHDRSKSNYAKCFRNFYFSQYAKLTKV